MRSYSHQDGRFQPNRGRGRRHILERVEKNTLATTDNLSSRTKNFDFCFVFRTTCITFAPAKAKGQIPEWPNGADCKSAGLRLRWFESIFAHIAMSVISGKNCGSSSVDRALAFQAEGRGFEPRLPLLFLAV